MDFGEGAKKEGLVLYLTLGGGTGRDSSITIICLVRLMSDSESTSEGGVCGSKCLGRVRVVTGASGKAC